MFFGAHALGPVLKGNAGFKRFIAFLLTAGMIFAGTGDGIVNAYGYTAVKGTVNVKSGKARKEPSTKSAFAFGVTRDEAVTILDETKGDDGMTWYKVQVAGVTGYIRSDLINKSDIKVNTSSSSSAISLSDDVSVSSNTALTGQNIKGTDTSKALIKGTNVIVREEVGRQSGIRTTLQNGHELTIISSHKDGDDKTWYYVSFTKNGLNYKGYVRSDLVSTSGEAVVPSETNAGSSSSSASSSSSSFKTQVGSVKGQGVNIRMAPVDGKPLCRLNTGHSITVTNRIKSYDDYIWYYISFVYNKTAMTGFIRSDLTEGIKADDSTAGSDAVAASDASASSDTDKGKISGTIKGTGVRIREKAVNGNIVTQLDTGYPFTVLDEMNASDGYKWYHISFSRFGSEKTGYVRSDLVNITAASDKSSSSSSEQSKLSDSEFEERISVFPTGYRSKLRELHEKYPNWDIKGVDTGLDWNDVVAAETRVGKNLVSIRSIASWKSTEPQAYNWETDSWYGFDGGSWASASAELIKYYLDPRNFLDESGIFMFEKLDHQDYQNEDGVSKVLASTFMSGKYTDTDGQELSYAQTFMKAGSDNDINPCFLAAKAIQEQGVKGSSQSISGNVSGLENLFNYFNIGAYAANGNTATINGLYYAAGSDDSYSRPWNSRFKSIYGAAKYISDKYVTAGQNTIYTQKFNVTNKTSGGYYSHQYMSNILAPSSEAARLKKAYEDDMNRTIKFRIPYYSNMPDSPCEKPSSDSNPNTYLSSLSVEEYDISPAFSPVTDTYHVTLRSDDGHFVIKAGAVSGSSSVSGTGEYECESGEHEYKITVKSQNGSTKTYRIITNKD